MLVASATVFLLSRRAVRASHSISIDGSLASSYTTLHGSQILKTTDLCAALQRVPIPGKTPTFDVNHKVGEGWLLWAGLPLDELRWFRLAIVQMMHPAHA